MIAQRQKKINVICLKWGDKYSADDVNKLQIMVEKNLSYQHDFYCLTDNSEELNSKVIPLLLDKSIKLKGWWYKVLFFQEKFFNLQDEILFFDLDVVIVQSIDALIDYEFDVPLVIATDFSYPQKSYGGFNSSVFRLRLGSMPHVWNIFQKNSDKIVSLLHGDQDWIDVAAMEYSLYPEEWIIPFKSEACNSKAKSFGILGESIRKLGLFLPKGESSIPNQCKVVIFNGNPKPQDVSSKAYLHWKKSSWIVKAWEK